VGIETFFGGDLPRVGFAGLGMLLQVAGRSCLVWDGCTSSFSSIISPRSIAVRPLHYGSNYSFLEFGTSAKRPVFKFLLDLIFVLFSLIKSSLRVLFV